MVRHRKGANTSNEKRGEHNVHTCRSCDKAAHCIEQLDSHCRHVSLLIFHFAMFRTEDPAERAVQMMMGIIGESKSHAQSYWELLQHVGHPQRQ